MNRAGLLDRLDCGPGVHVNADRAKFLHEPAEEIRIKVLQHALVPLHDRDLRPGTRGDVGELCSDVARRRPERFAGAGFRTARESS